jgi:hypothetical protein
MLRNMDLIINISIKCISFPAPLNKIYVGLRGESFDHRIFDNLGRSWGSLGPWCIIILDLSVCWVVVCRIVVF